MTPEERRALRAGRMRAFHAANPDKLRKRETAANRLTDLAIKAKIAEAKEQDRRLLIHDGGGLYLQVSPKGSAYWLFKYRLHGQAKSLGLGPYPLLTLGTSRDPITGEAREGARDMAERERRRLRLDGEDPMTARRAERTARAEAAPAPAAKSLTFREEALAYLSRRSPGMKAKAEADMRARLKNWIFPVIGDMDVCAIEVADVGRVLEPVWARRVGADVHLDILAVMRSAIVGKHRDGSNPAELEALYHWGLSKAQTVRVKGKRHALPYQHAPKFLASVRALDSIPCPGRAGAASHRLGC